MISIYLSVHVALLPYLASRRETNLSDLVSLIGHAEDRYKLNSENYSGCVCSN